MAEWQHNRSSAWHGNLRCYATEREQEQLRLSPAAPLLYMGAEIELEMPGHLSGTQLARHVQKYRFVKDSAGDCSLSHGLEIRVSPITLAWLKEYFEEYKEFLDDLRLKHECRAYRTSTCGGHIHLSRDAFVGDHAFRFMHMMYARDNRQAWKTLSRRQAVNLDKWAPFETRADTDAHVHAKLQSGAHGAVRVATETFEIRMFRGTLSPRGMRRNYEFCDAIFNYTKKAEREERTVKAFRAWIDERQEDYPMLHAFMNRKQLT